MPDKIKKMVWSGRILFTTELTREQALDRIEELRLNPGTSIRPEAYQMVRACMRFFDDNYK